MEQKNFRDCTLVFLDRTFGLRRLRKQPALTEWITTPAEILPHEETILQLYKQSLEDNVQYWNEQELSLNFIGPIFSLVNFTEPYQYGFFCTANHNRYCWQLRTIGQTRRHDSIGVWRARNTFFCFSRV